MALTSGAKLGPYEILSALGAGGMGEVYRARDTRLGRDVAIKVLPQHLSDDPELKERFEREARAISALSHPHICHLYDIGSQDGTDFLVMELLEGESLDKRLERGPLPLRQALEVGVQIAEALEKAHKSGIVHRDLKPGNIVLKKSGAKLLDFGLAKPAQSMAAMASGSMATMSKPLTGEGRLVGTYQYMAPEQIRGEHADARADIFALGAVLYEMVTSQRAFTGKSQISVMSAILEREPQPISAVQPLTPPALDHAIARALMKDAEDRWQSAADLRAELKWIAATASRPETQIAAPRSQKENILRLSALLIFAFLVAAALFLYFKSQNHAELPVMRSFLLAPEKVTFAFLGANGSVALSPDGRTVAFVGRSDGITRIWVRSLDSYDAHPIAGTEGAAQLFWSPDSRNLGFFVQNKLRRVAVAGGPPITLCSVEVGGPGQGPRGGSWNRDDVIIYGTWPGEIYRVAATGGSPAKVTSFDPSRHDITHRWPQFLPDGNHFVYMASTYGSYNEDNVFYVGSLDGKTNRILFRGSSNIAYANGYLLYVFDKNLMVRPFDPAKLEVTGDAIPLAAGLQYDSMFSESVFSASDNNLLIYQTGNASSVRSMAIFDSSGKQIKVPTVPGAYYYPRLSPDAKRIAYHAIDQQNGKSDVWLLEIASGNRTRLTVDPVRSMTPVWSRDGTQVAYYSVRSGKPVVYVKAANSMAMEQKVWDPPVSAWATDWTLDSKGLILQELSPSTRKWRLLLLRLDQKTSPLPLLEAAGASVTAAQLSPDGRWMAYQSDESGKQEVYISAFPKPEGRQQISVAGGTLPHWRGDGKELFYLAPDGKLMSVELQEINGLLQSTSSRSLFQTHATAGTFDNYDVTPDGKGFLVNTVGTDETAEPLDLVVNWTSELKK